MKRLMDTTCLVENISNSLTEPGVISGYRGVTFFASTNNLRGTVAKEDMDRQGRLFI